MSTSEYDYIEGTYICTICDEQIEKFFLESHTDTHGNMLVQKLVALVNQILEEGMLLDLFDAVVAEIDIIFTASYKNRCYQFFVDAAKAYVKKRFTGLNGESAAERIEWFVGECREVLEIFDGLGKAGSKINTSWYKVEYGCVDLDVMLRMVLTDLPKDMFVDITEDVVNSVGVVEDAMIKEIATILYSDPPYGHKHYSSVFEARIFTHFTGLYNEKAVGINERVGDVVQEINLMLENISSLEERNSKLFLPQTVSHLTNIYVKSHYHKLITDFFPRENNGLLSMLDNNDTENLEKTISVLLRMDVVPIIASHLKSHVFENELKQGDFSPSGYISSIISLRKKYNILSHSMCNRSEFRSVVTEGFSKIFHQDKETANLFVDYIHLYLIRDSKTMNEDERILTVESISDIFELISEKLEFGYLYRKKLATRLLRRWSPSIEDELNIVSALNLHPGTQFGHESKKMIDDLSKSIILSKEYESVRSNSDIIFSVSLLSKNSWPTQKTEFCNLSDDLLYLQSSFMDFWRTKDEVHSGKVRVEWQMNLGYCIIEANIGGKIYEIKLSTYQMCILSQFNTNDSLSFSKLQYLTGISSSELEKELYGLSRYKIITKNNSEELEINELFQKEEHFEIMPFALYNVESKINLLEKIDAHRRDLIDATIVRFMKREGIQKESDLIQKVIESLSSQFNANKSIIDSRLKVLEEKNYFQKTDNLLDYIPNQITSC